LLVAPEPSLQVNRVKTTLSRFGLRLLTLCRQFGVRVLLVSDVPSAVVPALLTAGDCTCDAAAAAYFVDDRLCYLNLPALEAEDEFGDPVTLTFALAIDHAMGVDGFASAKSSAVLAGYTACQDAEPGHTFLDGYCAESPQHYFAQAMEAYLSSPDGPLQWDEGSGAYCSRSELYDLDRSIYTYVDYLMRDVGQPG